MKENTTFIYSSNVVQGQVTTNAESRAISDGSNSKRFSTEVVNQRQVTADAKRGAADGALQEFLICISGGCNNISTSTNPGDEIKISHGLVEISHSNLILSNVFGLS